MCGVCSLLVSLSDFCADILSSIPIQVIQIPKVNMKPYNLVASKKKMLMYNTNSLYNFNKITEVFHLSSNPFDLNCMLL